MKKKFKIFSFILALFMSLFIGISVSAAEAPMENRIVEEVNYLVKNGSLPSWHLNYVDDDGYQAYFYKMKYLNGNFSGFASETSGQIATHCSWYRTEQTETWDYIIQNLDIEPEYLEPNKYLGIYWDSVVNNKIEEGYLYLIWTSEYLPSEFVTLLSFKESGKTYKLYDNQEAMDNFQMNWLDSTYYHYKDNNLSLHITPIGGLTGGKNFGIELKQKYSFEGFTFGMDQGQYSTDMDPKGYFKGDCTDSMEFDLGLTPKQDGKNAMQLCTHAYDYITDCDVQSYYDYAFGGYKHMVHFNLSISPDQIYRVDTKYTISNSNKKWYEFWKPDDSHTITKSLTPDKSRGGILGLFHYAGFSEGSYSSVRNSSKKYKYELLLDYDDKAWLWRIFTGQEYKESDYAKVDSFKILRINYLLDDEVYDVAIKMDVVEGGTYNIFSPDLIEDDTSIQHQVKTWGYDLVENVKDKWESSKWIFYTIIGVAGTVALVVIYIKVKYTFKILMMNTSNTNDSGGGGKSTCKKKKK